MNKSNPRTQTILTLSQSRRHKHGTSNLMTSEGVNQFGGIHSESKEQKNYKTIKILLSYLCILSASLAHSPSYPS